MHKDKIFWTASYPKSGNTWLRLILCGIFFTDNGNLQNLDILNNIPKLDTFENFKFIKKLSLKDYKTIFNNTEYDHESTSTLAKYWLESQKIINKDKRINFFKTHNARLKFKNFVYTNELTTSGFIYIYRDPRDIVISYSKHLNKDLDSTINFIKNNNIMGNKKTKNRMPEFIYNWQDHYRSWKNFIKVPSLFIRFEDLLYDPEKEINKIILFFKSNYKIEILNKNQKIKNIIKSTNFENLQNIEKKLGFIEKSEYSKFFREGSCGQWKKKLDKKQIISIENAFEKLMAELNYI